MATQSIERVVHARETTSTAQMKRKFTNSGIFAILMVLTILWLIPLAWSLDTALKPESETTIIPLTWISSHFTLQAFASTLSSSDLPRWYFNSILTSVVVSLATVVLASMAAYAFSRIPFRGRGVLFWIILAGIMIPGQVLIVPLFALMQSFGLVDTYPGIILPQIASPFAVFIFKQFFDGIPRDYEEAALMDGAHRLRVYWQILLPLARPAIATVAILTFVASWNNFIWPFIVITDTKMMTIPVGLATVQILWHSLCPNHGFRSTRGATCGDHIPLLPTTDRGGFSRRSERIRMGL